MKVYIVYEWMIDWDWNVQKVFDTRSKAEVWIKENKAKTLPCTLKLEECEVE